MKKHDVPVLAQAGLTLDTYDAIGDVIALLQTALQCPDHAQADRFSEGAYRVLEMVNEALAYEALRAVEAGREEACHE